MKPSAVSPSEAKAMLERGERVVFVDARNPVAWGSSAVKLPGAIRVPVDEVDEHLSEVPRGSTAITYCTWPHEASSARAAQLLMDRGLTDVHYLKGGFEAWRQAGYQLEPKGGP